MEGRGETISLLETCNILQKSKRTISRWCKAGKLHPQKKKGEYHFKRTEVESLQPDTTGQMAGQSYIVSFLIKQLEEKDKQIGELLNRQRETNILTGRLQEQILQLDNKPKDKDAGGGFFGRWFKKRW